MAYLPPVKLETHTSWFDILLTVLHEHAESDPYFARVGADLVSHFAALGSKCVELDATERLRILHDFYRQGEEAEFRFNAREMMKRGHDFRDYSVLRGRV